MSRESVPPHHGAEAAEGNIVIPSPERIPGSARGARVGGLLVAAFFGSALYLPTLAADWSLPETRSALLFVPLFVFLIVRPWFMGIWLTDDSVLLRGWFRKTEIPTSHVEGVTLARYSGLLSYGSIGWIPFAGSIAVVKIREATGRRRDFPGTVGRRRTVGAVARRIRQRCGIAATRYSFDPSE